MCRYLQRALALAGYLAVAALSLGTAPRAAAFSVTPGGTVGFGTLQEEWRGRVIRLSWKPRAFLLKGFLTEAECDHLIGLSKGKLVKSTVVDQNTGKPMDSRTRTSTGTYFQRGEDEVISRIENRVAAVSMVPVDHQEGIQILRYVDGQKYEAHADFFREGFNQDMSHGGQRFLTLLMYLSTPEEGGETVFPAAEHRSEGPGLSECGRTGLANKPYKGDALMFYSLTPDGVEDEQSLHGSCPTLKGEKWSATKWIHIAPYGSPTAAPPAGSCADASPECAAWASAGECKKNPGYMLASCRLACGACKPQKETPVIDVPPKT